MISFRSIKQLAIISAIILIPVICLNLLHFSLNHDSQTASHNVKQSATTVPVVSTKSDEQQFEGMGFFSEYRMERERVRGRQIEMLKNLASNPSNAQKVRDEAAMKLVRVAERTEKEMQAETLIKAAGIRDCAVIIEDAGVSIILESTAVSDEQKEDIIKRSSLATGVKTDKITIDVRKSGR